MIIPVDLPTILLECILRSPNPFKFGLVGRWFAASALVAVLKSARVSLEMFDTDKSVRLGKQLHDEIKALLGLDDLTEDLTRRYAPVFTCTAEVIQHLLKMFASKLFLTDVSTLSCAHILCSVTRT